MSAVLDLKSFLNSHPWPAHMLASGARPLDFLWHFDLALSAAELWPWLSDTSRLNRAMKLSRMEFWDQGGVRYGRTRNAGQLQEWVEVPWTWIARRTLTNVREYSRGFARFVRAIYVLEPRGERAVRAHIYFGWIPRNGWGRTFIRVGFPGFERRYRKALGDIEKHLNAARATSPFREPPEALAPAAHTRLAGLSRQLAERLPKDLGTDAGALAERLRAHIETSEDSELGRIQVRPLARAWGVPERALLVACLHATRVGLLALSWDIVCPHCRGVRKEAQTLGDLPEAAECEPCGIDFNTDREEAVEVSFHVHPSIREVTQAFFCSAEPAKKPHMELVQRLAPGEALRCETTLPAGSYRCRLHGDKAFVRLEVEERGAAELTWSASALPAAAVVRPGAAVLLSNPTGHPVTFVIETAGFGVDALRPGQLFGIQEFRDLFSQESLAAEVKLSIGEQTILFTDMVGSTRFYETAGDPGAFAEVRRHFTQVFDEIRKHRGCVVKTIGDAAMAAFPDPALALRAAAGIHARFDGRAGSQVRLRISINTGPCMAVNLNANIDYFGRTVNLAAKLQSLVEAGQIVFPRSIEQAPGVREFLTERGAELEPLELVHKAIDVPLPVYRWATSASAASQTSSARRAPG